MPVVLIDLVLAIVMATAGVILGLWLRGTGLGRRSGPGGNQVRHARQVLARLHQLATRVAADVGEHNSRVEEINEELSSNPAHEAEDVVAVVDKLIQANDRMQEQLGTAEEKLQEQARLVESHAAQARTDALTGLANRRAFDDEIARRFAEFQRRGSVLSAIMLDVDHFKQVNDAHGHQAGDEVLRAVAGVLCETARQTDLVARYGGEEFAMILPGIPVADAITHAERVRKAIDATHFRFAETDLHATASFGVAESLQSEDAVTLIQRADAALYASKDAGRNCVRWHDGQSVQPLRAEEKLPEQRTPEQQPQPEIQAPKPEEPQADDDRRQERRTQPPREPAPISAETQSGTFSERRNDGQTAACNRTEFCMVLGHRLAQWRRGGPLPAVLLLRIDDYTRIVAGHGERAVDLAMRAAAQLLNTAIRQMDLVAHYDVATLAVLLAADRLADTIELAECIREAIARCALPLDGGRLRFTVSLSGAEATGNDGIERLLGRADEALDAASKSGGNCCYFHNGKWSETATAVLERLGPSAVNLP